MAALLGGLGQLQPLPEVLQHTGRGRRVCFVRALRAALRCGRARCQRMVACLPGTSKCACPPLPGSMHQQAMQQRTCTAGIMAPLHSPLQRSHSSLFSCLCFFFVSYLSGGT